MKERYRVLNQEGQEIAVGEYQTELASFCNKKVGRLNYSSSQSNFGIPLKGIIDVQSSKKGTLISLFHDTEFHENGLLESASAGNKFRLEKIEDGN